MAIVTKAFSGVCLIIGVIGVGFCLKKAMNSNLFLLQRVEVNFSSSDSPINTQTLLRVAAVPLRKANLFELNLGEIEKRILTLDWVKEVRIQKKMLHTLNITVILREPKAIIQLPKGTLTYVDEEGKAFGHVSLNGIHDLPILGGLPVDKRERIQSALQLVTHWDRSPLKRLSILSTVNWDPEKGFRVLASYDLAKNNQIRTMVDIGQEIDETLDEKLLRLSRVFDYLSARSIIVRQVWVDAGKKVIVKTAHGS